MSACHFSLPISQRRDKNKEKDKDRDKDKGKGKEKDKGKGLSISLLVCLLVFRLSYNFFSWCCLDAVLVLSWALTTDDGAVYLVPCLCIRCLPMSVLLSLCMSPASLVCLCVSLPCCLSVSTKPKRPKTRPRDQRQDQRS
jgi:hypothetical protein